MIKKKYKLLRIIASLDPKYGGPARGIIESSKQLANSGFKIDILTFDKKKIKNKNYKNIKFLNINSFIGEKYKFSIKFLFWLLKNKSKYSFFIIHGLWQFPTLAARLTIKNKYFVYTHGQLDPFFKNDLFKRLKKQIYWLLIEKKNLIYSKSLLLTSKGERLSLNNTYVKTNNIKKEVVRYGVYKPKVNKKYALKLFFNKFSNLKNKNFYLFLGRFHQKKGCEIIIETIYKIKDKINFYILLAGPFTGSNYEKKIKAKVIELKLQKRIFFSNAHYNDLKWGSILASKGMILPSHGENFGVSLAESLSLGKPVITTNKVNIANDIIKYKAGLISNNNTSSFSKKLFEFDNLSKSKLSKMSNNCLGCFKDNFDLAYNKKSLVKLLIKKQNNE